jgi:hypothetical protein
MTLVAQGHRHFGRPGAVSDTHRALTLHLFHDLAMMALLMGGVIVSIAALRVPAIRR